MNRLHLFTIGFVLLSLPYPLISYGTTGGNAMLWWLGFAMLVIGGLLPLLAKSTRSEGST